jgi:hypothetical protein
MITRRTALKAAGWVVIPLLLLFISAALLFYTGRVGNAEWAFIRPIPLPEGAAQVQVAFPSIEGVRNTDYETHLPAEAVIKHYQQILPGRGWLSVCRSWESETYTKDCPESIRSYPGILEYFSKDGMTLLIYIQDSDSPQAGIVHKVSLSERLWLLRPSREIPAEGRIYLTPGVYPAPGAETLTPLPAYP